MQPLSLPEISPTVNFSRLDVELDALDPPKCLVSLEARSQVANTTAAVAGRTRFIKEPPQIET